LQVFFRFHIFCFVGFFVFSYIHYPYTWSYFLPCLLLYAVDLVLRAGQLANTTTVTAASVKPGGDVVSLQLQAGMVRIKNGLCYQAVGAKARHQGRCWQGWGPAQIQGAEVEAVALPACCLRHYHCRRRRCRRRCHCRACDKSGVVLHGHVQEFSPCPLQDI
jgi:hypothetical protein